MLYPAELSVLNSKGAGVYLNPAFQQTLHNFL